MDGVNNLPRLAICLLTWNRTAEAVRTIQSTCDHLKYAGEIGWYVGDDGSSAEHHYEVLKEINIHGMQLIGEHNERFRDDESFHCGKGWNRALGIAHQWTDYVLWLEDDWVMESDLEIGRYIRLLQDREEVGIVSFRILSTGANVHTVGWDGEIFLKYQRTTQYSYSGNPLLRHARYVKYYGWFAEDRNPGLIELHQDHQYDTDMHEGPEIWRPATMDPWGGWHHIGEKVWHDG